ncbi:MAG: type II toxin-antitoxin system HicA family toxin [Candidatus Rokuibacteriota bacterium]
MRLPRDVSGDDLARALADLGYHTTRQTGSHLRLTTLERGEHHITTPRHAALRVGTLASPRIRSASLAMKPVYSGNSSPKRMAAALADAPSL